MRWKERVGLWARAGGGNRNGRCAHDQQIVWLAWALGAALGWLKVHTHSHTQLSTTTCRLATSLV